MKLFFMYFIFFLTKKGHVLDNFESHFDQNTEQIVIKNKNDP